jgi:hypothetical protein
MACADAQERTQLELQQRRMLEQEADAALPERRILRGAQRKIRERLVGADVEQPEHHPARVEALGGALEKLELLVLGGKAAAHEIAEFGAIEPDAVGLVEQRGFRVGELVHVGKKPDARSVERDRGQLHELEQLLLVGADLAFQSLVLLLYRAFRIDEHDPGDAVDDQPIAGCDGERGLVHRHHRRHAERARQHRGV